jgi:hypothetical protein
MYCRKGGVVNDRTDLSMARNDNRAIEKVIADKNVIGVKARLRKAN